MTADKNHCKIFHADDEAYFDKVAYWTRRASTAATTAETSARTTREWVQAWTEIKG